MRKFMDVKQSGVVKEYRQQFERLLVYLPPFRDQIMNDIFLKGLKEEIQVKLSKENKKGLLNLMDATIKVEKLFRQLGRPTNRYISTVIEGARGPVEPGDNT